MNQEENQLLLEHARAIPAVGYAYAKILIYLEKHRHCIISHQVLPIEQIYSMSSAAIESTVKQIDYRTKIYAAQWNIKNDYFDLQISL